MFVCTIIICLFFINRLEHSPCYDSILCNLICRVGLHPMDVEVGRWLRRHAPGIKPVVVMNKSESLDDASGSLTAVAIEAGRLGFGDPIAISAETGLGMADLYQALKPLLEDHMLHSSKGKIKVFHHLSACSLFSVSEGINPIFFKWLLRLRVVIYWCP